MLSSCSVLGIIGVEETSVVLCCVIGVLFMLSQPTAVSYIENPGLVLTPWWWVKQEEWITSSNIEPVYVTLADQTLEQTF
jgi:hypothetical protein